VKNAKDEQFRKTSYLDIKKDWTDFTFWLFVLAILTSIQAYTLWNSKGDIHGDVSLYHRVMMSFWDGQLPYRDFVFEYPPYVLVWFIIPSFFEGLRHFQVAFGIEILLLDLAVKGFLVWLGIFKIEKQQWMIPVLSFTVATTANYFFYLQRFDLIPAVISIALLVSFIEKRYLLSGLLTSFGIGCKLYPVLFVPPLLILAYRQQRCRDFITGLFWGMLPLLILSFFMPWWQFLAFHAGRGLQAESLYASILWFLSNLGIVEANWTWVRAWCEVDSPLNPILIPIAQTIFIATVFYSEIFVCWRVWKRLEWDINSLSRLLLIPLVAFIAFNQVLSPQYLIWTAGLASVAIMNGRLGGPFLLIVAAVIIPFFYPSSGYGSHFNLFQASALVLRNLALIAALYCLVAELWPTTSPKKGPTPQST